MHTRTYTHTLSFSPLFLLNNAQSDLVIGSLKHCYNYWQKLISNELTSDLVLWAFFFASIIWITNVHEKMLE